MKMTKLTAAVAATMAATAQAATISGGALDGVNTDTAATAVSAIAIVGNPTLVDGLRTLQGIADCGGSTDIACSPSISSAELRAILSNATGNTSAITNANGDDLGTASGFAGKTGNIREYAATGVVDALSSFAGSGVIGGFSCGQGSALNLSNSVATDAATNTGVATNAANVGFIHAVEADGNLPFIKLDGVAPSALALASSNYNLVSNLDGTGTAADASVNGITVGVVAAGAGVASHSPAACSPLTTGGAIADVNGGTI